MKTLGLLIALLAACGPAGARYSSFDQNIGRVFEVNENLMVDYQNGMAVMETWMLNVDSIQQNEDLMTPDFLSSVNQFFETFMSGQAQIYSELKVMLEEADYVVRNLGSFDLLLTEDFRGLVEFIAALQMNDDDEQLNSLFSSFIGHKNVMHFLYKTIFQNVRDLTTTLINIFDVNETFEAEATGGEVGELGFTIAELNTYYYLIGYVNKMRDLHGDFNKIQEKLMLNKISWEQSMNSFDDSLDLLKTYYHRIYVQGVNPSADVLPTAEDGSGAAEGIGEFDETEENEETANPTNICDINVTGNFNIPGLEKAEEISQFEPLEECPNIQMSCCDKEELTKAYTAFQNNQLVTLKLKYLFVYKALKQILKSYELFLDRAYRVAKLRTVDETCAAAAQKVIFFPISRVYVSNFNQFMQKAFAFGTKSRNGLFCSVCDFDFHKTILETRSIEFSNNFCSEMMTNTFDFAKNFYVQLMDYFGSVAQVYQCDLETGAFRSEVALSFEVPDFVKDVFAKCDAGSEGFCLPYCQEFSFASMTSIFDIDATLVRDFYAFLELKVKEEGESLGPSLPGALVFTASNEYDVQYNKAVLDVDLLDYQFVGNEEQTGQNPSFTGPTIQGVDTFFN